MERNLTFVYIMVDDAGYGDFSCFGQKKFKTPNVDRMAKEGMKLTDFYASSTVCAPSSSSLMTGHHSGRGYIRGNKEIKPEGQHPLPLKAVTIPEVLKQSGYVSGMFGKWGLGAPGSEGDPMNQGFDRFLRTELPASVPQLLPPPMYGATGQKYPSIASIIPIA